MTTIVLSKRKSKFQEPFQNLLLGFQWASVPTQNDFLEISDDPGITGTNSFPGWLSHEITSGSGAILQEGTTHTPSFEKLEFGEMFLLEIAAERGDEKAFIATANSMDWNQRTPEDYVRAIHLALSAGAHLKARYISEEGAKRYPAHIVLRKFSRLLAPPKILMNEEPPDPTLRLNHDWLMDHWEEYHGRWVALKEGELLGEAKTLKELIKIIGDPRGTGILVTQV